MKILETRRDGDEELEVSGEDCKGTESQTLAVEVETACEKGLMGLDTEVGVETQPNETPFHKTPIRRTPVLTWADTNTLSAAPSLLSQNSTLQAATGVSNQNRAHHPARPASILTPFVDLPLCVLDWVYASAESGDDDNLAAQRSVGDEDAVGHARDAWNESPGLALESRNHDCPVYRGPQLIGAKTTYERTCPSYDDGEDVEFSSFLCPDQAY